MKRVFILILFAAVLVYFGLLPFKANDVSKLLPVETVIVTRDGAQYRVDIGAGVKAVGRTLAEALDRLKEQVSGVIFFQTAEQVIVQEQAAEVVEQAVREPRFRPAAGLWLTPEQNPDPDAISAYLSARHTPLTLGEARGRLASGSPLRLPQLIPAADGGYRILA